MTAIITTQITVQNPFASLIAGAVAAYVLIGVLVGAIMFVLRGPDIPAWIGIITSIYLAAIWPFTVAGTLKDILTGYDKYANGDK